MRGHLCVVRLLGFLVQGELTLVEVEVLAGITVNVLQRHVVLEERVPPCREMHAPA